MKAQDTALLLIGFQNDYFSETGILNHVFEDKDQVQSVLHHTRHFIEALLPTDLLIVETPIHFTPDYSELSDPVGILKLIKDKGAFKDDQPGVETIDAIKNISEKILSLPGKRGLNCFSNTQLSRLLKQKKITNIMIAGAVTSLCIDTAGREAMDLGYRVTMLSDCILGRTAFEQNYYLNEIMPLYSQVVSSTDVLTMLER